MRARTQARLAWILTAAFLVTTPVTGSGQCPCRFFVVPHTPTPAPTRTSLIPAPPSGCKCCRFGTDRKAPAQFGDCGQKQASTPSDPANEPCDHRLVVDAAAGSVSERPETTGGDCGSNPPVASETHARPQTANGSLTGAVEFPPRSCAHLIRYAHAFRC